MLVDIVFFDKYVDTDTLRQLVKVDFEIVSKQPCFSRHIRLRKRYNQVYTFNIKRYKSNVLKFSYGMLYRLNISEDDFEWIDIIMTSSGYVQDKITCNTIETTYKDFVKNKYNVIGKSENVICYTAEDSDLFKTIYRNRHMVVDFHKSLLINLI